MFTSNAWKTNVVVQVKVQDVNNIISDHPEDPRRLVKVSATSSHNNWIPKYYSVLTFTSLSGQK